MSILEGLRSAWIKFSENKGNGGIIHSEDNELIEQKLDAILEIVFENANEDKEILRDALLVISNRRGFLYPVDKKKSKWRYSLAINENVQSYFFELSVCDKKVIEVVATTSLDGNYIVDFSVKYYGDISEFLNYGSDKGTRMIDIKRLEDNSIVYTDLVYLLDLLNNSYSAEFLEDKWVGNIRAPLLAKKH
jgi:hypothetical protein